MMSALPSLFTSAVANNTDVCCLTGRVYLTGAAKVPSPFAICTEKVLSTGTREYVWIRSGIPSPLRSAVSMWLVYWMAAVSTRLKVATPAAAGIEEIVNRSMLSGQQIRDTGPLRAGWESFIRRFVFLRLLLARRLSRNNQQMEELCRQPDVIDVL